MMEAKKKYEKPAFRLVTDLGSILECLSYIKNTIVSGANNGLSPAGTFYHTWDKLNGWSKLALFGICLLYTSRCV